MMRKNWSIKISFIIIISLSYLLISGIISLNAQDGFSPESVYEGKEVFEKKNCIQCHSIYDRGGDGGPDLGKNKFYGTYLDFAALIWNHFPEMSEKMEKQGLSFPELTTTETEQLMAYIAFVRYKGEPGHIFTGKKLLKSKKCVKCHKFGGEGGEIGPDITEELEYLSPIILVETMWNHGPAMMEIFEKYAIGRPQFNKNEIIDLAEAIQDYMKPTNRIPPGSYDLGNPAKGRKLLTEKNCLSCHSLNGKGGELADDFAEMDFNKSVTEIAGMMWNHAPKMWALMEKENITIPEFERGDMADIVGYFYSMQLEDTPGDKEQGKKILSDKGCLSCHTTEDQNREKRALSRMNLDEFNSPLKMVTAMFNHAKSMEKMRSEKKLFWPELSGRDMADLYAYLYFLSSSNKSGM